MVADVSVPAEHLHAVVPAPDRGGESLAGRFRDVRERRLASIDLPRGAPQREPRGVDLDGHVGDLERDRLKRSDRLAERLALGGVLRRVLEGRPCASHRDRAGQQLRPQHGLRELVRGSESVSRVVEPNDRGRRCLEAQLVLIEFARPIEVLDRDHRRCVGFTEHRSLLS
jgi:hypothetical protein